MWQQKCLDVSSFRLAHDRRFTDHGQTLLLWAHTVYGSTLHNTHISSKNVPTTLLLFYMVLLFRLRAAAGQKWAATRAVQAGSEAVAELSGARGCVGVRRRWQQKRRTKLLQSDVRTRADTRTKRATSTTESLRYILLLTTTITCAQHM